MYNLLAYRKTRLSKELEKRQHYGVGCSEKVLYDQIDEVNSLYESVERWMLRYKRFPEHEELEECCPCSLKDRQLEANIKQLGEKIKLSKVNDYFEKVTVDEYYILKNPKCNSYEDYERAAKRYCYEIGVEVKRQDQVCNFTLDIVRSTIPCELIYSLGVVQKACNLGYSVMSTAAQCKAQWQILVTEDNCDIPFNIYSKAVNKGITYDIVKDIYNSNLSLTTNDDGRLVLKGGTANYLLEDFDFSNFITSNPDLYDKFHTEPLVLVEKILADYDLTSAQIKKLIK